MTGVQTCALPILGKRPQRGSRAVLKDQSSLRTTNPDSRQSTHLQVAFEASEALYYENSHDFLLPRKSLSLEQAPPPLPVSPISYKFCKISCTFKFLFEPKKATVFVKLLVWPQLIAWTRLLNNTKFIMLMPIIFWIS